MKKYFICCITLIVFVLLEFSSSVANAGSAALCSQPQNGSQLNPIVFPQATTDPYSCSSPLDGYKMNLYEVGLCNTLDIKNPTQPPNFTSCTKVFTNPASVEITINSTGSGFSSVDLTNSGTFNIPATGDYQYVYFIMQNYTSVQGAKWIRDETNLISNPNAVVTGDHSGTGNVCWTVGQTVINHQEGTTADCGNSPTPGFLRREMTNLECGNGPYYCDTTSTGGGSRLDGPVVYLLNNGILPVYTSSTPWYDGTNYNWAGLLPVNQLVGVFQKTTTVPNNVSVGTLTFDILGGMVINDNSGIISTGKGFFPSSTFTFQ